MFKRALIMSAAVNLLFLLFPHAALGGSDFPEIDAKELKTLLDTSPNVCLLNPLSNLEFEQCYIPGSVNIPLHTIPTTDLLPADRNTVVVTYCLGRK